MRFSSALVADVTTLNFNLMFEIGFGIGLGQPVIPIRDTTFASDKRLFEEFGMLDTLGYVDFVNSAELVENVKQNTTAYEMADTKPDVAKAIYAFEGSTALGYGDVVGLLLDSGLPEDEIDDAINLLLWFGFIGVGTDGTELYSHTAQFNIARLRSLIGAGKGTFVVHPAFRAGLGIEA